jgi:hypothetical protein
MVSWVSGALVLLLDPFSKTMSGPRGGAEWTEWLYVLLSIAFCSIPYGILMVILLRKSFLGMRMTALACLVVGIFIIPSVALGGLFAAWAYNLIQFIFAVSMPVA